MRLLAPFLLVTMLACSASPEDGEPDAAGPYAADHAGVGPDAGLEPGADGGRQAPGSGSSAGDAGGQAGDAGTEPTGGVGTFLRVGFHDQHLAAGPDGVMHLTFLDGAAERVYYAGLGLPEHAAAHRPGRLDVLTGDDPERRAASLVEEAPEAYRDIREVLGEEADLVVRRERLEPLLVLKG